MLRIIGAVFLALGLGGGVLLVAPRHFVQSREDKVRNDRKIVEAQGFWIYNDLARGFAEARNTGKPMLVTFRCIPCEECVKLDEELIHQDDRVRPLLDKFVRIRVVSMNGVDLSLFQFDFDQSFAVMMLNADGTIYGRYGTRSHRTEWQKDVSIEGLAKALEGALRLHANYPANQAELVDKKGPALEYPVPEKYPHLAGKFSPNLDYTGNVVKSCIHCHQVGDAQRQFHRGRKNTPFSDRVLFQYPHPKSIGLILDPKECAKVLRVEKDSIANRSGFQAGDIIQRLEGQRPLSVADVQWVLHHTNGSGAELKVEVIRHGQPHHFMLALPNGWRRLDDISWRATTWPLRQQLLGGMVLKSMTAVERRGLGLDETAMAFRVDHVGQFSPHDIAKRAGIQKGDIIVRFDGRTDLHRETDAIAHMIDKNETSPALTITVLRDGQRREIEIIRSR